MAEPSASKTITLGKEYDVKLRTTLMGVLREVGADVSDKWRAVVGSQEIDRLEMTVDGQSVAVEAETYVGLSVTGKPELVQRIAELVRLKQE